MGRAETVLLRVVDCVVLLTQEVHKQAEGGSARDGYRVRDGSFAKVGTYIRPEPGGSAVFGAEPQGCTPTFRG